MFYNFEEMERKDTVMGNKNIGIKQYDYFYERPQTLQSAGKIEEFISDKDNVGFGGRMQDPVVYREVAKELAKMHLTPYAELPLSIKYTDCTYWNWNTDCIYQHLKTGWRAAKPEMVADWLGYDVAVMDNEYKWCDEMVHSGNGEIVFAHNDAHGHNMMIGVNEDGSPNPDSFQMIDFDNGEFGYRAWDFEYYWSYWVPGPSSEEIDDMINAYLNV